MLQRNLLCAAVTRARELVVLVGSKQAIALAVRNNKVVQRNTRLAQRLRDSSFKAASGVPQHSFGLGAESNVA